MDIAKYIGLFLLKNNFCYLQGLGNLELKKKPASYDGDALHAPEYDVILTQGGSIDDTLANYIATHEQTSISKAANALREFSTATRAELTVGKEVEIPGVGRFTEQDGAVEFVANPQLKHVPPPVPMLRMSRRLEETPDFRREPLENDSGDDRPAVVWGKIALIGLLLAAMIVGIIFWARHYNSSGAVGKADTTAVVPATAKPAPVANTPQPGGYPVIINTFYTRAGAEKRAAKLRANGNKVEVISRDSATHIIIVRIATPSTDTARVLDSLRRLFNPRGVYLLRQ